MEQCEAEGNSIFYKLYLTRFCKIGKTCGTLQNELQNESKKEKGFKECECWMHTKNWFVKACVSDNLLRQIAQKLTEKISKRQFHSNGRVASQLKYQRKYFVAKNPLQVRNYSFNKNDIVYTFQPSYLNAYETHHKVYENISFPTEQYIEIKALSNFPSVCNFLARDCKRVKGIWGYT